MQKPKKQAKSPLTLLVLIGVLVIATLVMLSNYFLRPGMELDLKHQILESLDKVEYGD